MLTKARHSAMVLFQLHLNNLHFGLGHLSAWVNLNQTHNVSAPQFLI